MPCFTMVPPRGDHPIHGHFWVPIDDDNCWPWSFDYHPVRPLHAYEVLGDTVSRRAMEFTANWMADAVVRAVRDVQPDGEVRGLFLTALLGDHGPIDGIMFSGGVAEYIYGRADRDFGDMGRLLGLAVRKRIDEGALPWTLLPAQVCSRATALGASEYSIQLSGSTIFISNAAALLPRTTSPTCKRWS